VRDVHNRLIEFKAKLFAEIFKYKIAKMVSNFSVFINLAAKISFELTAN